MARFGQQDADRIADFLERLASKARRRLKDGRWIDSQFVEFHGKAGAQAANGFGSGSDGSGIRTSSPSTTTESAALANVRSKALVAWAGMLDALNTLHNFESELADVLREETNTGRENTVDVCAGCNEPIVGVGNDRVKRLDGQPYHAGSCWWSVYNATRGRRGA